ncbi:uncharacterized protein LOC143099194 isoform X2 [Alosa pseudoharengus]|uniref:uncharacterized protein LOC143099194 isoform X2 n=1 Tax=Alosa pseudoharengus TaxID=34774 RepID=UPI003F8B5A93
MNTSIKLILLHLHVLSCVRHKVIQVRGYEGGDAVLDCPSQKGYESSPKYLRRVKNEQENPVEVIRSDGNAEWTHRGRVSLLDMKDKDIFTVTIRNLTLEDSNMYWCGVDVTCETCYIMSILEVAVNCESDCNGSVAVRGYEGGDAVINCPFHERYESIPKYLLKGDYIDGAEVIRSDGSSNWIHRGRISIQDMKDRKIFTVTIRNLIAEDTGTYWCGVAGKDYDLYDRTVSLEVVIQGTTPTLVIPEYTTGGSTATNKNTSGVLLFISASVAAVSILMIILVTGVLYMQRRQRRERPTEAPRHLASGRAEGGHSRKNVSQTADFEDPNTTQPDADYQSLNHNPSQPDAVYQSLNPNTIQPDAVYQSLNPNTTQPDAVYQSLNYNPTQPDAVYQSLNPNTIQPDAVYQSLNPNTTQPDAVYQSLNPNTTQPDAVYQSLNPNTTQPDAVYQSLFFNTSETAVMH